MLDLEQIAVPAFAVAVGRDGAFRYIAVNALNEAWSGFTTAFLAGKVPQDLFAPAVAERLCGHYSSCVEQRRTVEYEVSSDFATGRSWWLATLTPLLGPSGAIETLLGTCAVVTEDRRLGLDLEANGLHLDLALRCLKGADWRYDVGSGAYHASPNLALLMGEDRPRPVAWSEWADRVFAEDLENTSCSTLLSGEAAEQVVRFRFRGKEDETRWAQCRRLVTTKGRSTPLICGVVTDVTDERRRELNLEAEADRDGLTGLLNRRGFKRELDRLAGAANGGAALAILMLDLDGFKLINDRFGHAAGDDVLVEVGNRLGSILGECAILARLGGDEFVAAMPEVDETEASALARRLSAAIARPFLCNGVRTGAGGSIGLSWRHRPADLAVMMAEADDQLYRNKRLRKRESEEISTGEASGQISLFAA